MLTLEQLRASVHRQAGELEFRMRQFVYLLKSDAAELGPAEPVSIAHYFQTASALLDAARKLTVTLDAIRGLEEKEAESRNRAESVLDDLQRG